MAFNLRDSIKDVLLYEDKNNSKNLGQGSTVTKPVTTTVSTPTATPTATPTSSSSNVSSVQTSTTPQRDYYSELMAAINEQTRLNREAQIAALDAQLKRGLSDYDAQISALEPVYQQYRNQSEVERYKAQNALRENQANRGALDSGLGRQEVLDLQTNYGNNLNTINMQYQAELDALNRAKQTLNDDYAAQKIQIENDLDNVGLENKIALLKEQMANQQQASRTAAENVVSNAKKSNQSTASTAAANVDKLIQKHQSLGKAKTSTSVAQIIANGYSNGTLNEDDVKQLAAKYGINVK